MNTRRWMCVCLMAAATIFGAGQVLAGSDDHVISQTAREHLALLLEASPAERINYLVETPEHGHALIQLTVDTFFARDMSRLGGVDAAALLAASVIDTWEKHKIRWEEGMSLFTSKAWVIENEGQARMLGEIIYDLAAITVRMNHEGTRAISTSKSINKVLRTVLPETSDSALLMQYYQGVREIGNLSDAELERYAVLANR